MRRGDEGREVAVILFIITPRKHELAYAIGLPSRQSRCRVDTSFWDIQLLPSRAGINHIFKSGKMAAVAAGVPIHRRRSQCSIGGRVKASEAKREGESIRLRTRTSHDMAVSDSDLGDRGSPRIESHSTRSAREGPKIRGRHEPRLIPKLFHHRHPTPRRSSGSIRCPSTDAYLSVGVCRSTGT